MGHNYHHVRAAVRGGRKKKIPSPKEDSVTDLGHAMPAHQLNSGGNRKGLGTEDWGLATWAREPGTDKQTDRRTDRMTDIFCRPSRPLNPELGFTTLGQNYNTTT